jgi:sulfhydrogenase subunit alpha
MENALGIKPSEQTLILRDLQTIGERIRSHATHLYILALPDYLGYESAIEMAPKFPKEIARALRLMKLGNDMVVAVSGRVMHQVATNVGYFTHYPKQEDLELFRKRLEAAKSEIFETAKLIASLKLPDLEIDSPFFSLTMKDMYAISYGDVKVGEKTFKQKDYDSVIREYHEPYSNANFVVKEGKAYYVGALARINNNYKFLSPEAKKFMKKVGFVVPNKNPFYNNLSQAIELIHYWEECVKLLKKFKVKHEDAPKIKIKAGHGIAANEAPRGTLWHEYKIDDNGMITYGRIIAPTTQLLRHMQDAIAKYVQQMLDSGKPQEQIVFEIEKLIRTYDPCFSCATHFLEVKWNIK